MSIHVIQVDPADNFYSLRDRLLQSGQNRAVLVLSADKSPLRVIDLVLLRRLADRERMEIGLVTEDRMIGSEARHLGLPVFATIGLAEHFQPGWWRARRHRDRLGLAAGRYRRTVSGETARDKGAAGSFVLPVVIPALILIATLFAFAMYWLPRASVSLRPSAVPVQVILELHAGPAGEPGSVIAVPARRVSTDQSWEAVGRSTGDAVADWQRVRPTALQELRSVAPHILGSHLEPGLQLAPASTQIDIIGETMAHEDGQARLSLTVRISGLAVRAADVNRIALRELSRVLPAGYLPDPGSLRIRLEPSDVTAVDEFQVTAQATGLAAADSASLAEAIRGRGLNEASNYLSTSLMLDGPPHIEVAPDWLWGRLGLLPLRPGNIEIILQTGQ